MSHQRETVTFGAPEAVGPYSHAVRAGGLLFCSGQIALEPRAGEPDPDTPAEQADRRPARPRSGRAATEARLVDAACVTVCMTDMGGFAEIDEAYAAFFEADPPARVAIGGLALPEGAQVEIDAVMALDSE